MSPCRPTRWAKDDLAEIARRTVERFGVDRADRAVGEFSESFDKLARRTPRDRTGPRRPVRGVREQCRTSRVLGWFIVIHRRLDGEPERMEVGSIIDGKKRRAALGTLDELIEGARRAKGGDPT